MLVYSITLLRLRAIRISESPPSQFPRCFLSFILPRTIATCKDTIWSRATRVQRCPGSPIAIWGVLHWKWAVYHRSTWSHWRTTALEREVKQKKPNGGQGKCENWVINYWFCVPSVGWCRIMIWLDHELSCIVIKGKYDGNSDVTINICHSISLSLADQYLMINPNCPWENV